MFCCLLSDKLYLIWVIDTGLISHSSDSPYWVNMCCFNPSGPLVTSLRHCLIVRSDGTDSSSTTKASALSPSAYDTLFLPDIGDSETFFFANALAIWNMEHVVPAFSSSSFIRQLSM